MAASMQDKLVLISGATRGIGAETALELAQMGAQVIVTGRDPARLDSIVGQIHANGGQADGFTADLSLLKEVNRLADEILARYPRLDVLINNAGALFLRRQVSSEGIEMTWALNHLSPFLLTHRLLDLVKASRSGRVITVSSDAHYRGTIHFDDLEGKRGYTGMRAYSQSKLANVLFAYELARRLEGERVTSNALHPGFVASHFARNNGWLVDAAMHLVHLAAIPIREGAQTSVYLASSAEVEGVTGKYFERKKAVQSNPESCNLAVAARLWEISLEMTGLSAPEGRN
ncbi:MAG TPA: SDR family oxidoreductase [Anaerolineaceae bacterium]|nr:SDR family oxidoreductase [Anaerolineaceae bacterium]